MTSHNVTLEPPTVAQAQHAGFLRSCHRTSVCKDPDGLLASNMTQSQMQGHDQRTMDDPFVCNFEDVHPPNPPFTTKTCRRLTQ